MGQSLLQKMNTPKGSEMKTSELTGTALNWAVAKAEGMHVTMTRGGWFVFDSDAYREFCNDYDDDKLQSFRPSTNWAQGGAIIERERVCLLDQGGDYWQALCGWTETFGDTPLIAAMRCYVASKLGDEVEVPAELI
jgi:hypothetical protein